MRVPTLLGAMLPQIFYGAYCVIFALYLQIQFKRKTGYKSLLLYGLTANFILCTAYLANKMTMVLLNENDVVARNYLILANDILYTCIDFISQGVLLYRCWMIWRQPLIMVVPIIVTLAFLATSLAALMLLVVASDRNNPLGVSVPSWYFPMVVAFFSLSLALNAVVTGLIVLKVIIVHRGTQTVGNRAGLVNGRGPRDLYPVVSILIESGLMTFVGQLVQTVLFSVDNDMFPIVSGAVVQLYGISSTVVLVRVVRGAASEKEVSKPSSSNAIRFAGLGSNDTQSFELTGTVHKDSNCTTLIPVY